MSAQFLALFTFISNAPGPTVLMTKLFEFKMVVNKKLGFVQISNSFVILLQYKRLKCKVRKSNTYIQHNSLGEQLATK